MASQQSQHRSYLGLKGERIKVADTIYHKSETYNTQTPLLNYMASAKVGYILIRRVIGMPRRRCTSYLATMLDSGCPRLGTAAVDALLWSSSLVLIGNSGLVS